jgi:hypothetical protein
MIHICEHDGSFVAYIIDPEKINDENAEVLITYLFWSFEDLIEKIDDQSNWFYSRKVYLPPYKVLYVANDLNDLKNKHPEAFI